MKMIVAVDKNWGIGFENKLLVLIPADIKFFHQETLGKVVVMGRKTLESFPNGLPLANRTNIVLTSNKNYNGNGAIVVHNAGELLTELQKYNSGEIYVIGGGSIYEMMLPYCDLVYVTKIENEFKADTYFPNLDQIPEWEATASSDEQEYKDFNYRFMQYEKNKIEDR